MMPSRRITCPRCGAPVRIPIYWALGIEGIFRCRACRQTFKTGYKMGAFLSALALCLAVAAVQLLVYLFSSYSLGLFALALIPLWLTTAFCLRKAWMMRRVRAAARRTPLAEETDDGEEVNQSVEPEPKSLEEQYFSLRRLPRDTAFEENPPAGPEEE